MTGSLGPVRVELRGITKRFDTGVVANEAVNIRAGAGEVIGVVGENGAGKTTAMKILAGYVRPDQGEILLDNSPVSFKNPRDAMRAGISIVHQHQSLIPSLTVAENLALGRSDVGFRMDSRTLAQQTDTEARALGFEIRAGVPVAQLSLGERQRVEIFRLIREAGQILILDEPTSLLAPVEAEIMFDHLRRLAASGRTVLFVTHKIRQVLAIADRIYVMRRGKVAAEHLVSEVSERKLAALMTGGRESDEAAKRPAPPAISSDPVVRVTNVEAPPRRSAFGVRNVSFEVSAGEILGISGISGNGQEDLVMALAGLDSYRGRISILGRRPEEVLAACGHIPADPRRVGSVGTMSLAENLALDVFRRPAGAWLDYDQMRRNAAEKIARFHIVAPGVDAPAGTLSGGNLQKLIVARELSGDPQFLLAVNATAGLDVATVAFVRQLLLDCAARGAAVLLVSEDLDELLAISHRILVMHAGMIVGERPATPDFLPDIGLLMSGLDPLEAPTQARGV